MGSELKISLFCIYALFSSVLMQCSDSTDCNLYNPVCSTGQCVGCLTDDDCAALSDLFVLCGQYGSCEAPVEETSSSYHPLNIVAVILVFVLYAGTITLLIIAVVYTNRTSTAFSTKMISSTEMESTTS